MSDQPISEQSAAGRDAGLALRASYSATRDSVADYFDRSASKIWARLTTDEDDSTIRQALGDGRDAMREMILTSLPDDLSGRRILDAGCGVGQLSAELARRGADVLAVDISPSIIDIAQKRNPSDKITYVNGDMLNTTHGVFDHVVAMDSLIYYGTVDLGAALSALKLRTARSIVFTVAPRTPMLAVYYGVGRHFSKSGGTPATYVQSQSRLEKNLSRPLNRVGRVRSGLYCSDCFEVRR